MLATYPMTSKVPEIFLRLYIKTKIAYARCNARHGKITKEVRQAIVDAGRRLLRYQSDSFMEYFPISRIQSGGGTSTNMLVNEVLANLACKEL
ncbi:MAG: hypothetical protein H6765_04245 [Candidatus Peribacteria bacterium]|nr:MAG: hypothetical protein H6765_04245 [Candidatus Peribacteria bacterium]